MNSETIGILIGIGSSLIILAVYYLVRANKWKKYTENTTGHIKSIEYQGRSGSIAYFSYHVDGKEYLGTTHTPTLKPSEQA